MQPPDAVTSFFLLKLTSLPHVSPKVPHALQSLSGTSLRSRVRHQSREFNSRFINSYNKMPLLKDATVGLLLLLVSAGDQPQGSQTEGPLTAHWIWCKLFQHLVLMESLFFSEHMRACFYCGGDGNNPERCR